MSKNNKEKVAAIPSPPEVEEEKEDVKSSGGSTSIKLRKR
jgi:hypothetical protein